MGIWIGRGKRARIAYGFDDVALVPGSMTIDPMDVDTRCKIGDMEMEIPVFAAAMDGVVDVGFAIEMGKLGGLAVLNLEGLQTKYEDPKEKLEEIVNAPKDKVTNILQEIYREPVKKGLILQRISEIKKKGEKAVVSVTPGKADEYVDILKESGLDLLVVQSTVTTVRYESSRQRTVDFSRLCQMMKIPVVVGNCVNYDACLELMESGVDGVLIGVGPGATCTTRQVLGIGVPQVTASLDAASARDFYYRKRGRYVPIIMDGGMKSGGDICKAIASGSDAVMMGSVFAKAKEAPGRGYHWGMATPSILLPRGTRIRVGIHGNLSEILYGPAHSDDGSHNLIGALKDAMGSCGARNIRDMHMCEIIVAPSIRTEGKGHQFHQNVGMWRSI